MVLAQLTRAARPFGACDGVERTLSAVSRGVSSGVRGNRDDAAGLFTFGFDEILVAIDAGQPPR